MDKSSMPILVGVNAAPVNPNAPSNYPLQYTGIAPVPFVTGTGTVAFITTSIAAAVPAAAVVADIFAGVSLLNNVCGARKTGSGIVRNLASAGGSVPWATECSGQQVDLWDPAAGNDYYYVIGYWS